MNSTQLRLLPIPGPTPALEAAVGSLPADFRLTGNPAHPHVAWVTGGPGWADDAAAALDAGALAVVLDSAGPITPAEIARFADQPVLLVGTRTHAPQLRGLSTALSGLGEPALVDVLVVDGGPVAPEPAAALWDAVAMLTAAGLELSSVPQVGLGEGVLLAEAWIGGARLHLTCVHRPGAAPRAVVKVLASDGSYHATMGDPLVALPGEVLVVQQDGARLAATHYLTPRRAALGELHDAMTGHGRPLAGLALHARVGHLLSQVTWPDPEHQASTQLEGTNR